MISIQTSKSEVDPKWYCVYKTDAMDSYPICWKIQKYKSQVKLLGLGM